MYDPEQFRAETDSQTHNSLPNQQSVITTSSYKTTALEDSKLFADSICSNMFCVTSKTQSQKYNMAICTYWKFTML